MQPELLVEIDFYNDPNPDVDVMPDPIWTDVTAYVRVGGFSLRRGRARTLDRNEAGTCTILLDNRDRRFDGSWVQGPYYPYIRPNRRIRLQTLVETGTTPFHVGDSFVGSTDVLDGGIVVVGLFWGYTDSWTLDYPSQGFDATVTVRATDMFGLLSQDFITATWTADDLAPSMHRILNERAYTGRVAGSEGTTLSSPARDIADGRLLRAGEYTNVSMLAALQELANSDGGNFFISREGRLTYLAPETRTTKPDLIPVYGLTGEGVSSISREFDDTLIYNQVTVTAAEETLTATVSDTTSIARYGLHPITIATQLADENACTARANEILEQYRSPVTAIRRLEMRNTTTDWQQVLQTDLWGVILIQVPLPDASTFEQVSLVEGISISSVSNFEWNIVWELSVAEPYPNLLTANQQSFEDGDTTGWAAEDNCTIAASTYWHYEGAYAMQIAATIDGDASVLADGADVEGGADYAASAYVMGSLYQSLSGQARLEIDWYNGGYISTSVGTDTTIRNFGSWSYVTVSAAAPSAATSAEIRLVLLDAIAPTSAPEQAFYNLECSYMDSVSLRRTI